jgi:single-stranded DNA-binding protein
MSLPVVSGKGYLLTEGIELKYSKNGVAYARLPLAFKNSRKSPDGTWTHDKEVIIEGTIFGALAESLADLVTSRQELNFSGEIFIEEYEGKKYVKANVHSAWPVKETRTPAAVGARTVSAGDDLPF